MKKTSYLFIPLLILSVSFFIARSTLALSAPSNLKGKILLQVESKGEAWYVSPADGKRHSLGRPNDAFNLMRQLGVGISNDNLKKIKIADENLIGQDSDNDGLSDMAEDAIGTDKNNQDSDADSYNDKDEIMGGYNPSGNGKLNLDNNFAKGQSGKILLQVEKHGEAWYVNPDNNQRYFMSRPGDAFNLMRKLGLGISNSNLASIKQSTTENLIPAGWKTYKNSGFGFQISYPQQYWFLDSGENHSGPLHYLIPQKPRSESGNYGVYFEIANLTGTSTIKGILQAVAPPLAVKNIKDLWQKVKTEVINAYKTQNIPVELSSITIGGQDFPALIAQRSKQKEMLAYYLVPPGKIYGREQGVRLLLLQYVPVDDKIFKQIVSTLKPVPLVFDNIALYESARTNKDTFWCDKISDDNLKGSCYIEVRGPIYDSHPIDFSAIARGSGGQGGAVNGTTLTINGGKGSNAWLTGAISNNTNMNYIEFDVDMVNGEQAQSLLTVYLNTTEIGTVDGRVQSGQGHYKFSAYLESNDKITDPIPPGLYSLGFRLDTFASGTASAKLSNIKWGLMH